MVSMDWFRRGIITKIVSLIVLSSFLCFNNSYASLEKPLQAQAKDTSQKELLVDEIGISKDLGTIKTRFKGKENKLIIHIQDAHCNYEAQTNISKILENLSKNYNINVVSVEGADGYIDTSWFKSFPDAEIRKEVADYFMKKGEITGAEFLSITKECPVKLYGAEDRSLYLKNLNAFTSAYPTKDQIEKYLVNIKTLLSKLKPHIYSKDLLNLDTITEEYKDKKKTVSDYAKVLSLQMKRHSLDLHSYPDFAKLVYTLVYEDKINFKIVDQERANLIDALTKAVSKEKLKEMVEKSIAFKTGRMQPSEYYGYLKKTADENNVDFAGLCPNLGNYIIYSRLYEKIDTENLFDEIDKIKNAVKEKLFENEDQRTLSRSWDTVNILLGLINIKLSNKEYGIYKAGRDKFNIDSIAEFLNAKARTYNLAYDITAPTNIVKENLPRLESFYEIASKRDKVLVDNTIASMNTEKVSAAVLITGGFHTSGLSKIFEDRGISYLVVCPTITKDVESPYIKVLTNQKMPFDDILTESATPQKKESLLAALSRIEMVHLHQMGNLAEHLRGLSPADIGNIEAVASDIEDGWVTITVNTRFVGRVDLRGVQGSHVAASDARPSQLVLAAFANELRTRLEAHHVPPAVIDATLQKIAGMRLVSPGATSAGPEAVIAPQQFDIYDRLLEQYKGNVTEVPMDNGVTVRVMGNDFEGVLLDYNYRALLEGRPFAPFSRAHPGTFHGAVPNGQTSISDFMWNHTNLTKAEKAKLANHEKAHVDIYMQRGDTYNLWRAYVAECEQGRKVINQEAFVDGLPGCNIANIRIKMATAQAGRVMKQAVEEFASATADTRPKVYERRLLEACLLAAEYHEIAPLLAFINNTEVPGAVRNAAIRRLNKRFDMSDLVGRSSPAGHLVLTAVSNTAGTTRQGAAAGSNIRRNLRISTYTGGQVDVTNCLAHIPRDVDMPPIIPTDKGGLTEQELLGELSAVDAVRPQLVASVKSGMLSWPKRVDGLRAKGDILRDIRQRFRPCFDIVVLGASPVCQALVELFGQPVNKNFYFVNSPADADTVVKVLRARNKKPVNIGAIFISDGVGDAVQSQNYEYLTSELLPTVKTNILAIAPAGLPIRQAVENNKGLTIVTPPLNTADGIPFNAEALAVLLMLSGHNRELKIITNLAEQEFASTCASARTSQTAAGSLSAVLRGQNKKQVKKFERLDPTPFEVTTVATYDTQSTILMRALAAQWNTVLGGRTQLDVAAMPDGQHHQFQMGLSALGHSVINVVPAQYQDAGPDGVIPAYANSSVASKPAAGSRPESPFTLKEFMEQHLQALSGNSGAGWMATNNPTPNMKVTYKTTAKGTHGQETMEPAVAAASLISLFQLAEVISRQAALADKRHDQTTPVIQPASLISQELVGLDTDIRNASKSLVAERTNNVLLCTPSVGNIWLDMRGLLTPLGLIDSRGELQTGPVQQQALGAALSIQTLAQFNYRDSGGKTHLFLRGPLDAAKAKKDKFVQERAKARQIGHEGENYFIFAVGGAHNSSVNGMIPLPKVRNGKKVTYIDTLDPAVISQMCETIRKDPLSVRLLYVSNSGDTDESDVAFRIAQRTFLNAIAQQGVQLPPDEWRGAAPQAVTDHSQRLSAIMDREVTMNDYLLLHNRVLVVTREGGGKLRDEMAYVGFEMCPYPLTNGRQSIFELGLLNQAFLGISEEETQSYITGAQAYTDRMMVLPEVKGKDKKPLKKAFKELNALADTLLAGKASRAQVEQALAYLRQDPGFFAGSLIGLLNRPDIPDTTGFEARLKPREKLRVIYLSDMLHNDWLVKNDLVESLGKPQIQLVACDNSSSDLLQQLAGITTEDNSTVIFVVDDDISPGVLESQNAILGAAEDYLARYGIPYLAVHTSPAPLEHAATTFLLQTMAMGIGGQQVTASGYPRDANHLGEVWVTRARTFVRDQIARYRAKKAEQALAVAGAQLQTTTAISAQSKNMADIIEQWNLSPLTNTDHRAFLDFTELAGRLNMRLFGIARGWDVSLAGDVRKIADAMVDEVVKAVRADENMRRTCCAVIVVNPVTQKPVRVDLNSSGSYFGVFVADNPFDSGVIANSSDAIFTLFKIDPTKKLEDQELFVKKEKDSDVSTNLVVETILKFGAYPTAYVVAPRYGQLVAYNYATQLADGAVAFSPKLVGANHLVVMPTLSQKKTVTAVGATGEFPPALRDFLHAKTDTQYKGRDMGGPITQAVFIADEGGITGGVQPLLNTFFAHDIFWHGACRGGHPVHFHQYGADDIPTSIPISTILDGKAMRPSLVIAADMATTEELVEIVRREKSTGDPSCLMLDPNSPLVVAPRWEGRRLSPDNVSLEDVVNTELGPSELIDESLRQDVVDVVKGLAFIAAVRLPPQYLNPESEEAVGSNPSAEISFGIDDVATDLAEAFAEQSCKLFAVIGEERDIRRYGTGRLILTTDPVDGVGNLQAGYPTGQFFTLSDAYTGRVLVTMVFGQGAGRLLVGFGNSTHAFQYTLDNYTTGTPINFGDMAALAQGHFFHLGRLLSERGDMSTPNATGPPAKLGEGGTVAEYIPSMRELRDECVVAGMSVPSNNGSVVNDAIAIAMSATTKTYVYPETTGAKIEKGGYGGKLRPTEELAMSISATGIVNGEFATWLAGAEGQREVDRRARELFAKLMNGKADGAHKYPEAFAAMRQVATDQLIRERGKGLTGTYGVQKNPMNYVPNLDDITTVPRLASPIFVGTPAYVKKFSEKAWDRYVEMKLASQQERDLAPEDWSAANDHEWEVYGPYARRAHLKANPAMGAVKLANGLWVPVLGQDNVSAKEGEPWLDTFARCQERMYREMMNQPLGDLETQQFPVELRRSPGAFAASGKQPTASQPAAGNVTQQVVSPAYEPALTTTQIAAGPAPAQTRSLEVELAKSPEPIREPIRRILAEPDVQALHPTFRNMTGPIMFLEFDVPGTTSDTILFHIDVSTGRSASGNKVTSYGFLFYYNNVMCSNESTTNPDKFVKMTLAYIRNQAEWSWAKMYQTAIMPNDLYPNVRPVSTKTMTAKAVYGPGQTTVEVASAGTAPSMSVEELPVNAALEVVKADFADGSLKKAMENKKGIQILVTTDVAQALYRGGNAETAGSIRFEERELRGIFAKLLQLEGDSFEVTIVPDWASARSRVKEGYIPIAWITDTQINEVRPQHDVAAFIATLRFVPISSALVGRLQQGFTGQGWFYARELEATSVHLACTTPEDIDQDTEKAQRLLEVINTMIETPVTSVADLKPLLPGTLTVDERFSGNLINRLLITKPIRAFNPQDALHTRRQVDWSV